MARCKRVASTLMLGGLLAVGLLMVLRGRPVAVGASPTELFVVPGGGGSCSQPAPCDLQTALIAASDGNSIYLAAGTYTGGGGAVVTIAHSISLYGGWDGAPGGPVVRAPDAYPTTIEGEGTRRGVFVHSGTTVALHGLRITGGNAAGRGGDPWGNDAGGGLYVDQATITISDCLIYGNTASTAAAGSGGGLLLRGAAATVTSCTVVSNTASAASHGHGGGLALVGGRVTVSGSTVQDNIASTSGWGYGGGVYLLNSPATLSGNTIAGNVASSAGKAWGGGLYVWYSEAMLNGNTVLGNVAGTADEGYGGGLVLSNSAATLCGNTIVSNTATLNSSSIGRGGAMYVWESGSWTLINNVLADNDARTAGSGVWLEGTSANGTSGRLLHTTIADNRSRGQGVFVGGYTTLALTNTIIAGHNSVGIYVTAGSTATLEATLWHNNGSNIAGSGTVISSTNVMGHPAFANSSGWDYHLTASSAAVDRGVNAGVTSDMDGDPRPMGLGCDIGADEFALAHVIHLPLVLRGRR